MKVKNTIGRPVQVMVHGESENATKIKLSSNRKLVQETEARYPVTDNIKDATEIIVSHTNIAPQFS